MNKIDVDEGVITAAKDLVNGVRGEFPRKVKGNWQHTKSRKLGLKLRQGAQGARDFVRGLRGKDTAAFKKYGKKDANIDTSNHPRFKAVKAGKKIRRLTKSALKGIKKVLV